MAEKQTMGISSVSDIITSRNDKKYFTLENNEGEKFICFQPALREKCAVGSSIEAEFTRKEGDTTRLDNIYIGGKPLVTPQTKESRRSSFTPRDEDRTDKRTAVMTIAEHFKDDVGLVTIAKDWCRKTLKTTGEIRTAYKEAKSETVKADSKTQAGTEVSEDEGTQKVLDSSERELTLGYVKALVEKNGLDTQQWFGDLRKIFTLPATANTERRVWEALDDSKKRLAIGGLK